MAFVTLFEPYLGINPDFDMWKYFFRIWHLQDPKAELVTSEGSMIHVKSGNRIYPYLDIPMPWSMKGWHKKLFYLNDDDSPRSLYLLAVALFTYLPRERGG
jgi:hypothetical protein